MIEAMEQQIINSINNRWTKNKKLRREIDMNKITESFRVICSSRVSILSIITEMKETSHFYEDIDKLKVRMNEIYNWITEECIISLIDRYKAPIKDKKKEAEYKAEIPEIEKNLQELNMDILDQTLEKLLKFHNIKKEV